jgi:hypothetical protein
MKTRHVGGIGLAAIFLLALVFPWDPHTNGVRDNPAFVVAAVISAVTAVAVGGRSSATLRSGALFGVLAVAAYCIACSIDYELGWRGVWWGSWGEQGAGGWGSHALLVAFSIIVYSPPLAAAGALLAWVGEVVTGGRLKGHGQQAAG